MFQRFNHRLGHYLLLLAAGMLLFLPNLGVPSLWDIDEGNNAEAAREMLMSGNYIVPTFNFELRVDKPALLYWLQIAAYNLFGVNEFAARFPSAIAALFAVFLTYELGRRMFNASTGLLAGFMLASTVLFCGAAHFANPDALLNVFTLLTFLFFWNSIARGDRSWFLLCGISAGLAVLAKGPVGLVLPSAVTLMYLFWAGQLRRLFDWRLLSGVLAFGLVMIPWYAWVAAETRGTYVKGFFLVHNVDRYLSPMEGHAGNPAYYVFVLLLGFAPWSAFLGLAVWYSFKFSPNQSEAPATGRNSVGWVESSRPTTPAVDFEDSTHPTRSLEIRARLKLRQNTCFLWCWIIVYFLFFSFSRTKLPNYILPIYPAVALLTARFLDRWRRGEIQPPAWAMHACLVYLALFGVGTIVALLMAGGVWSPSLLRGRHWPDVQIWGVLGAIPLGGAAAAWLCLRQGRRTGMVVSFAASGILFLAVLAAWGTSALEAHKAPRELVRDLHTKLTEHEVRVAAYGYFQPSLVFYCQRAVQKLQSEDETLEFLRHPLPVYLFLPATQWEALESRVQGTARLLGRRHDLYQNCDVVVVTNR